MSRANDQDAPRGTVETYFAPIHSAARMRDLAEVKRQLELGAQVDELNGRAKNGDGGNTPLWFACQGPWPGGLPLVSLLLEAGADVDRPCEHGTTALHLATSWGHVDVVQRLLTAGATSSVKDADGRTALDRVEQGFRGSDESKDELRALFARLDQ